MVNYQKLGQMTEAEYRETMRNQMDRAAEKGDLPTLTFLHNLWRIHCEIRDNFAEELRVVKETSKTG